MEATEPTLSLEEWKSVARDVLDKQQKAFFGDAMAIDLIRSDGVRLAHYTAPVEAHDPSGGLEVESAPRRGTKAAVYLPPSRIAWDSVIAQPAREAGDGPFKIVS
jgi:hypothetical protein